MRDFYFILQKEFFLLQSPSKGELCQRDSEKFGKNFGHQYCITQLCNGQWL